MIPAVALFVLFGCVLSEGLQLISVNAKSVNASEGTQVNFTCQTSFIPNDVTLVIVPMPPPNTMLQNIMSSLFALDEGGQEAGISFSATASVNETMIECRATNNTNGDRTEVGPPALLLVQGPPAGVSDLHVEYEDVCCALVAWDAPYTLSGVPIIGYNIIVDNTSTNSDSGPLNDTTLYLTGPGSYTVNVTPLIDTLSGDTDEILVDIPEIQFNLSVRQMVKSVEFVVEITGMCCKATPMNATLILSNSSSSIVTFPPFAISENDNNQIVTSIELEEYLLDRTLQSLILVTYTNGKVVSTVTRNFSTFDLLMANYSIVSEDGVCVECELIPGTQAQGCHVELECDNGDHTKQDFFTSGLSSASGCLPVAPNTPPTLCTLLFYDIEQDGNVSSNPALILDDVLVSGLILSSKPSPSSVYSTGMATTSTPSATGFSTTVIVIIVVVVILVVLFLLIGIGVAVYCYKTFKKRRKTRHQPNMYQLSELPEAQNSLVPSLQYADVMTPEAGSVVVLPVERNPVSYSSINFEQLGVTSVDVMMDHKQLMRFVAPRVSSKWYHVGVALALTPPLLEDIEQNNGGSHERCISDVFQAWREQRTRPYTWESLLIALRAGGVREMEFARELELQIESLNQHQHQQQTLATSTIQPPVEGYSRLQHHSNRSTPCVTPCRQMPNTSYDGPTSTSSSAISGTASTRLIQPGMTLDQLVGELTNKFASKWREVGTSLALTPPNLETIASRNCQEPTMCMTGVIQLWKHHQSRPYTLHTLITILKSIGEHEYARQLENYQISSST